MSLCAQYLGHLRPSRDLLEYYRQKIAEYDEEYEKLASKLEKYRCTYEDVVSKEDDSSNTSSPSLCILIIPP